jgi:hypothetical protein
MPVPIILFRESRKVMKYANETITIRQYSTEKVGAGAVLLSVLSVGHNFVFLRVGAIGLPNRDERLNIGEFMNFDVGESGLFEIRLLSVVGFVTATFLVTRIK